MRIQTPLDCELCTQRSNECNALKHIRSDIQSVEPGFHDAVLLAISLGKSQFDLAVEQNTVRQIEHHFIDLSHLRLSAHDPLFSVESGLISPKTAFSATPRSAYTRSFAPAEARDVKEFGKAK